MTGDATSGMTATLTVPSIVPSSSTRVGAYSRSCRIVGTRSDAVAHMSSASDHFSATREELVTRAGVKWTEHGPGVIGAFVAEMDFGIAPEIAAALHRAVDLAQVGYLSKPLMSELADACAGWYRIHTGWSPDPAWIHPLPDVVRGLEVAIRSFSAPGAAVILPTPAYMPFFDVPGEVGRSLLTAPMIEDGGRYRFDLDAIEAAFARGGGLLVLCNPCNPVGRVFTREELLALSEVVDSCGGRVFADEIHAPLVYEPNVHIPYASVSEVAAGHSVTAISASKAWNLPGLKCANLLLTNTDDAERWQHVGLLASHGASTIGVIANTVAYRAGDPWLADVMATLGANRQLLAATLAEQMPDISHRPPEGTYLAWLDCRRAVGSTAEFFVERAGVALTDGARCGAPGFVRLNFATTRSILEELLDRMTTALAA